MQALNSWWARGLLLAFTVTALMFAIATASTAQAGASRAGVDHMTSEMGGECDAMSAEMQDHMANMDQTHEMMQAGGMSFSRMGGMGSSGMGG